VEKCSYQFQVDGSGHWGEVGGYQFDGEHTVISAITQFFGAVSGSSQVSFTFSGVATTTLQCRIMPSHPWVTLTRGALTLALALALANGSYTLEARVA
jgi:hypothetical protein